MIKKYIAQTYVRLRSFFRYILILVFPKNSKVLNLFTSIDIFIRKSGVVNPLLNGNFNYKDLDFLYGPEDANIASFVVTNGSYELATEKEIMSILKPGDIFIDGGAHIGFYSLLAARFVGEEGKVYAFEPTESTRYYLEKNVKLNLFPNIFVSEYALSNIDGNVSFSVTKSSECNSVSSDQKTDNTIIQVPSTSLNSFCKNNHIDTVDLVKLDIEGQELNAIMGMSELIKENQNIKIIFEYNAEYEVTNSAAEIFSLLRSFGFNSFIALLDSPVSVNDDSVLKILSLRHNCNILATIQVK